VAINEKDGQDDDYLYVDSVEGIHVVMTLNSAVGWPAVKDFSSRFSRALAHAKPDIFTANICKAERKKRIFIDGLRNQRGANAVQPWSVRARPGAHVAIPILWSELDKMTSAGTFSLQRQDAIVERAGEAALRDWGTLKQALPAV